MFFYYRKTKVVVHYNFPKKNDIISIKVAFICLYLRIVLFISLVQLIKLGKVSILK